MKAWPATPFAVTALLMTAGPFTVSARVWLLLPTPFVAVSPMESAPAVVGVPEMTPLLKLAHAGSDEALSTMVAVPVAVSV